MEENFLKPKQVADILMINIVTVYKLVRSRKLRAFNIGNRGGDRKTYRIRESDLKRFIQNDDGNPKN